MVNLIILLMMIMEPERMTSYKPSQEELEDKLDYFVASQEEPEVSKKDKEAEYDINPEQDDEAVVEENPGSDYQSDYYGDYFEKEQVPFSKAQGTQQRQSVYGRRWKPR